MARIWHFLNEQGEDVIQEWVQRHVQRREMGRLQNKVDMLARSGSGLVPHLLADTGEPHIKKLKVKGSVQLRPLLCRITDNDADEEEFVLLMGAKEVGFQYEPADALKEAAQRREVVLNDESRKTAHVRFRKRGK